ncbi:selenocysteine-specific translation elongation factor [Myxococcota bacterium]
MAPPSLVASEYRMKRVILCTAGHIDHGKTTLVKALTGIDCDTHPEERARGITINPGFAHLDLSGGRDGAGSVRLGIVDVPGHHRFIRNMLVGACAVDMALLVVAADDGVMPQTREHVALLDLLGTRRGLVALTKWDLATPELADLARCDIEDFLAASSLADAEIVPVSAFTGAGLAELRAAILRVVWRVVERRPSGGFRMYIDRVFSVAGFGTVVTGSIMGGTVRVDASLLVLPGNLPVRVRRIECHGQRVDEAHGGERASLNISGLGRAQFVRGMLLADRPIAATQRIDAEVTVIGERTSIAHHGQALFYAGTHESSCHIRLLDRAVARAGDPVLAQIELESPAVLLAEDRFVLRSASADETLGGGRCVDPAPLRHRRRTERAVAQVRRRASSSAADRGVAEVQKRISWVSLGELAEVLGVEVETVKLAIPQMAAEDGVRVIPVGDDTFLLSRTGEEKLTRSIREALEQCHRDDPLGTNGAMVHQVASKLTLPNSHRIQLTQALLEGMTATGILRRSDRNGYLLADFSLRRAPALGEASSVAKTRFRAAGLHVVSLPELESELAARFQLSAREFKAIVRRLVEEGELVPADDAYLASDVVADCRRRLLERLASGSGLSVAQFRDLIDGNRRVCLMLLGLFDREGLTTRRGDQRFITDRGRAALVTLQKAEV